MKNVSTGISRVVHVSASLRKRKGEVMTIETSIAFALAVTAGLTQLASP